MEGHY